MAAGWVAAAIGLSYAPVSPAQDRPRPAQLLQLVTLISSGCMSDDEIARIPDEGAPACADPQAFLAANPDINYDGDVPIPQGEWVVVGSLPDTVLFQAGSYDQLLQLIIDSVGP